jgi:hypothetical protein
MLRLCTMLALFGVLVVTAGSVTADDPPGAKKKADTPEVKKKDDAADAKKKDAADLKKKTPPGPDVEAIFKQMDANGDGKISKAEFKDFAGKIGRGRLKNRPFLLERAFQRADADGDGYLTLEEVKELAARIRDRIGDRLPIP